MSYDQVLGTGIQVTYSFAAISFAANGNKKIRGPKGKRGQILNAEAYVSTAFVGTTSAAALQLGPAGSLTALLNMPFGTTGVPSPINTVLNASNITNALPGQLVGTLPWTYAAADTDLTVGFIAGVGTPAGVADIQITMGWF